MATNCDVGASSPSASGLSVPAQCFGGGGGAEIKQSPTVGARARRSKCRSIVLKTMLTTLLAEGNWLLAEANVPYDQLVEMEDINPRIDNVDVAVVIGANDVVNPAARNDENSPIYGMPIINVDQARTVFVLKRSMASGFSGVDNPLFFGENTRMLFGDAKDSISSVVAEFKT